MLGSSAPCSGHPLNANLVRSPLYRGHVLTQCLVIPPGTRITAYLSKHKGLEQSPHAWQGPGMPGTVLGPQNRVRAAKRGQGTGFCVGFQAPSTCSASVWAAPRQGQWQMDQGPPPPVLTVQEPGSHTCQSRATQGVPAKGVTVLSLTTKELT